MVPIMLVDVMRTGISFQNEAMIWVTGEIAF